MSDWTPSPGSQALRNFAQHLGTVASILANGLDEDTEFPDAPVLDVTELTQTDLPAATLALEDLARLQERIAGMQTRLAGEIAGMRRTRLDPAKPAPRSLDTSL